jgi:hypothetical protein
MNMDRFKRAIYTVKLDNLKFHYGVRDHEVGTDFVLHCAGKIFLKITQAEQIFARVITTGRKCVANMLLPTIWLRHASCIDGKFNNFC